MPSLGITKPLPWMKNDIKALNKSTVFFFFCIVLMTWKSNFCSLLREKVSKFCLCSVDFITQVLMNSDDCISLKKHMHQWASFPQFLNSWLLGDRGFHPEAVISSNLHFTLSLGWVLVTLSSLLNPIGSMPSVLISIKITPGMAVWLNDEAKWNANLGLVSDNNKCGAVAFISISAFHLEIRLGFGNTFISELWLFNQPWWLSQQSCVKEPWAVIELS